MHLFSGGVDAALAHYGYWALAFFVFIESMGVPSPGETMLIVAGANAGSSHQLAILPVIATAFVAAVLGDNTGYWIGREGGWRLVRRYGKAVGIDDATFKIGIYLFRRHGGKVVFFGRWIPLLRTWGALLAGTTRMPWARFAFWNVTSAALWTSTWGLLAFAFGHILAPLHGLVSLVALTTGLLITAVSAWLIHGQRHALRAAAEQALPGSLEELSKRPRRA